MTHTVEEDTTSPLEKSVKHAQIIRHVHEFAPLRDKPTALSDARAIYTYIVRFVSPPSSVTIKETFTRSVTPIPCVTCSFVNMSSL